MSTKFEDIVDALETASQAPTGGIDIFYHISTGKIYYDFVMGDNIEPLPDDIDDVTSYLRLPDYREIGLGRPLALAFAEEHLSQRDCDRVYAFFSRSGAFARFKDLLEDRGVIDAWYQYEHQAIEQAAREWCEEHSIATITDS